MASKTIILAIIASCCASALAQISASASQNPAGGADINLSASKLVGKPDLNVVGGVFASGNTKDNVPTFGAFGNINVEEHSLGISKTHTPGVSDTFGQNIRINFLNNEKHRLDANLFATNTKLNNGFNYNTRGASLDYNHRAGHGLSVGASHIPNFGTTGELSGRANLWSSPNRQSSLDLTGSASRTFDGPTPARNNFGVGLGFKHIF